MTTSPATRVHGPYGSATARSTSARTTSSALCSTPSCSTPATASACRGGSGRSSRRRPSARRSVWREPDQGIWEARGKPQHYVSSKLMCWVALDRAAQLAEIRGDPELQETWRATADEIKEDILANGLTDKGVLRQHYGTDALDASTLLAAILGFLPGDDERLRASVNAIADELTEDGFVLRYRTDETDDGLSGKEGTFLICSFWLVSGLAIVGELQRARDLMERLLRIASPLGPVRRGVRRGNRPSPRQLPPGLLAPGADRSGGENHRPRAAEGALSSRRLQVNSCPRPGRPRAAAPPRRASGTGRRPVPHRPGWRRPRRYRPSRRHPGRTPSPRQ